MATTLVLKFASLAVLMCLILATPFNGVAAIPCGQLQFTVAPCVGYVRNPSPTVPELCCNAIRTINNEARSTADRQANCRCLKSTSLSLPGLNLPALAALPGKCGIHWPYKITPSIDCNKVT